ncbi:fibronectin type III domain protein [Flavobacteriales bacterium ALC-1]|nr:fibronectin type III domain protein [Flavobacteriales bacterium ALC-1]
MKKITFLFMLLAVTFGFSQSPTDNPTTPPARDAGDVISIFSGAYTDVGGSDFNPNWGQAGFATANTAFDPGTGDLVLAYPNFNYQGNQFGSTQDISTMEFLHVDIWINNAFNPNVFVISSGGEIAHPITNSGAGTWTSVDIPVTGITGDLSSAIQFKFDGGNGSTDAIYVDNLYFWKNPTVAGSDATLSALEVDGSPLDGFASGVFNYNVDLAPGTTVVPQITTATPTDSNAMSVNITQASAIPGDATVVVTSQNGNVTETYTVSFAISGPSMAAPSPPNRPAADVVSVFSDAYSDISVNQWGPDWGPSSARINDVVVDGNASKLMDVASGQVFAGIDFAGAAFDATTFSTFHLDYYIDNPLPAGQVLNIKLSNHDGGAGETSAIQHTEAPQGGQWVSLDIPLDNFVDASAPANLARNAIAQIVITAARGDGNVPVKIYLDNIYFHKNTLGVNDFETVQVKVFPNPTNGDWNISGNSIINKITVYDILGKQVITLESNTNDVTINTSSIKSGIYIARIEGVNGSKTVKLIKE